jgi:hypothetical protein
VQRTLTPLVQLAMREHPASTRAVSWQGLGLFRANLAGVNLARFDFRDSKLDEASFHGSDLRAARFDAASLVGSCFDDANLAGANFQYADLAGATMRGANLQDADLRNIRLLDLDLHEADLRGARFAPHATDWRLTKNWRTATIDPALRERLLANHGPMLSGLRVAMLMWEFPPFVSGGGWTAAYHFLRNLRRRGADIVVFVPLPMLSLDRFLFGNEIQVVGVGPEGVFKSLADHSAYEFPSSAYSDIKVVRREWSGYAGGEKSLFAQVETFSTRVLRVVDEKRVRFDVIHAHDWLTFEAARALSETSGKPWVAHFHSTEDDRQPGRGDYHVARIESSACRDAARVVAVSNGTKRRLEHLYGAEPDRITVVPNCTSEPNHATSNLGAFDSRRVIYLGRLTRQKGADRFVEIARHVCDRPPKKDFRIFGDGECTMSCS